MADYGLHFWDLATVFIYFLIIIIVGIVGGRKIADTKDFFLGGRRFGKILSIAQSFGTGTNTAQFILMVGACYQLGVAGIWYQWYWLFITPFFWLIAPIYRRLRYVTIADFFQERYGPVLGRGYAFIALFYIVINIGMMLKSIAITVAGITNGAIPQALSILSVAIFVMIYGIAGGLLSVAITDLVQGFVTLAFSVIITPMAIVRLGGLDVLHHCLEPGMFDLFSATEVTPLFLVATIANGLVSVVVYPHHMAMIGSAKDEHTARIGWVGGTLLKRLITVGWVFIGLYCAALFPQLAASEREAAFGLFIQQVVPAGFLGFVIASLLATVMSTCDALMLSGSALVARNVPFPESMSRVMNRHPLIAARGLSFLVMSASLFFAFSMTTLVDGQKALWRVTALFGIPFWVGLLWKKANATGAVASILSALVVMLVTGNLFDFGLHWEIEKQICLYLPVGFLAMIVGSYIKTTHVTSARNFWNRLYRTGDENAPRSLATGLLLLDMFQKDRPGYKNYKTDLAGFALIWCLVSALFLGLWILIN